MSKSDPVLQTNYIAYNEETMFNLCFFIMEEKGVVSTIKYNKKKTCVLEETKQALRQRVYTAYQE